MKFLHLIDDEYLENNPSFVNNLTEEEKTYLINLAVSSWEEGIKKVGVEEVIRMMRLSDQKNNEHFQHLVPMWKVVIDRVHSNVSVSC